MEVTPEQDDLLAEQEQADRLLVPQEQDDLLAQQEQADRLLVPQQPDELPGQQMTPDEQLEPGQPLTPESSAALKAIVEAAIYLTDEPLTAQQIATAVGQSLPIIEEILRLLVNEYAAPDRGLSVRELAGGYKMSTKPEFHDQLRRFVKNLQPPLKLSLAALETLAVIAYKQPITGPEILDIRGVQGGSVLKTLLDRRLIATAGRKNVIGKPMMYKTTREFLIQFGLNSLSELPTLKEFEELGRIAFSEDEPEPALSEPALQLESQPEGQHDA